MAAFIQNLATVVPEQIYRQNFLREKMKDYLSGDRVTRSIIHQIYSRSGINKRHTVVNDFDTNGDPRLFFDSDGTFKTPSTKQRNDIYARHAKTLFVDVARSLLEENTEISKDNITHLITVSCTGFFAPGPDYEIVKKLSLSPSVKRFHLGFMGCYAAFPAMKMAQSFCDADPDAVVMIVSLELCSLHLQNSIQNDNLISASVFADGGAGALVSSNRPDTGKPVLELVNFATSIIEKSEDEMAWTIGNTGFDMILSTYVPDLIGSNLQASIQPLLQNITPGNTDIDYWAVHPGGRSILDKVSRNLDLQPEQLSASRTILSEYGNMSSATILFVLKHLWEQPVKKDTERILAMAFGPGLTVESGLMFKHTK